MQTKSTDISIGGRSVSEVENKNKNKTKWKTRFETTIINIEMDRQFIIHSLVILFFCPLNQMLNKVVDSIFSFTLLI